MAHSFSSLLLRLMAAVVCVLALPACQSATRLVKASPARLSSFLEHRQAMRSDPARAPWHAVWSSPSQAVHKRALAKTEIYVAPVTLSHLRPISKALAAAEYGGPARELEAQRVAGHLREQFVRAFYLDPQARLRPAGQPGPRSLTLELAITELDPTSAKGNVAKTAAKFAVGPLAGLAGYFTKGGIAIEAQLKNSATGETVYEFADREEDKITLYSLRDFAPYAHAMVAAEEWAAQFAELSRTPPRHAVGDARFFTLSPW